MKYQEHILIVDDEPNVRLMLRTTLESAGYAVDHAEDGAVALGLLAERAYDLVLLDLKTPRLDGIASLRQLRARGDRSPVVVLTAHGSVPDAVEAMKLGAIDFLSKPTTPARLREAAARAIERGKLDRATAATASRGGVDQPAAPAADEARGSFSILQDWFPSGVPANARGRRS